MPYKHLEDIHVPKSTKVLFGGIAGMLATALVQPLDVVKVRMQVYPKHISTIRMGSLIVRCEGLKALYAGLSAGMFRQATYTTTRLGCYNWLFSEFKRKHGQDPDLQQKLWIGIYAGLAGAFVGNPSEVVLVRLMADAPTRLCDPCSVGKQYKGFWDAFTGVIKEEGICGLWRGGNLTILRSIFVSTVQIGTYTHIRQAFREKNIGKGFELHFYTSVITSFLVAVVSLPVDVVKTLYQVRTYNEMSQAQIIRHLAKDRGISYFWHGLLPYFIRLVCHTFVTYFLLEEMNMRYRGYLKTQNDAEETKK